MVFDLLFAPMAVDEPDLDLVLQSIQIAQDKLAQGGKDPNTVHMELFG